MRRITLFAVGLSLLLLSTYVSNGQSRSAKPFAARNNLFAYKSERKISEINALAKKETRLAVRRKFPKYAGKWKGTLYQPDGTLRSKFNFTVRLYQKGQKVTGFSRITIIDAPQYYGVMRLRGTIKRNRLSFAETKITRENPEPDSRWCIKSGKLKLGYAKGKLTLKGNWQGPDCSPGTIVLRKVSGK
ncbi:MAG TPA: hypothetical protein VNB22_00545 [Pyrinomonadaceae bacterium]|nr:hypothetical protein [Pyrinomonadaceae bacterium]